MSGADRSILWTELRLLGVLALVVAGGAVFVMASGVFLLGFGAVLLAVLLNDLSAALSAHTPLSRSWTLPVVLLGVFGAIALFGWFAGPNLVDQGRQVMELLPQAALTLEQWLAGWTGGDAPRIRDALPSAEALVGTLPGIVTRTFGTLGTLAVVIALAIYLALDPTRYRDGAVCVFTPSRREGVRDCLDRIGLALGRWVRGQLLAAIIMGVSAYVVLSLLGVPLALSLAVLTGALEFVPYVGAIVAAIPVVLVALTESWSLAGYALAAYVALQVLEGYLIVPLVQRRAIRVPPAVILFSQVLLGVLFGVVGIILATPLVAVLAVLYRALYQEAVLEEHAPASAG